MCTRVGLYGGTFDPVHNGHISIAHSFLNSYLIDELWILLTPYPPHKVNTRKTGYSDRLNMLRLAFNSSNIQIVTIENELPMPSYTYQTVEYLARKNSKIEFYYCLGGDSLTNFHTWKYPDKILQYVDLLIAERTGSKYSNVDELILSKSTFVDHTPINVSSTQIKSLLSKDESITHLVPPDVEKYIQNHQLYSII